MERVVDERGQEPKTIDARAPIHKTASNLNLPEETLVSIPRAHDESRMYVMKSV